jgi:aryl-alcohol dehydrogenase-like predicted oxidoreductase
VAQIAIAWVAAQSDGIVPIIGARRREQLTEALGAMRLSLTQAGNGRGYSARSCARRSLFYRTPHTLR